MAHAIKIRNTETSITAVLELIARGHTYEQIMLKLPAINMADIAASAQVAAELINGCISTGDEAISIEGIFEYRARSQKLINLTEIRKDYPRAYEKWSPTEDERLSRMFHDRLPLTRIGLELQRQEGAIRTRLHKLGLLKKGDQL